MEPENEIKTKLLVARANFFFEIIIVFLGIFLFMLVPRIVLPNFLEPSSIFYGPLFYLLRALVLFLAIPIFLSVSFVLLESSKQERHNKTGINPYLEHLNLYKMSKSNFKYQLFYGVLILFLVFIPLDFFTYLFVPDMLEYTARTLTMNSTDTYLLLDNYCIFLVSVVIIQSSVSIYEETLVRGFLTKRGSEYFNYTSAAIISSFCFGLNHFAYYLNPISSEYPIWFPFIWFLEAFFVGIVLSLVLLKKKWIFPLIFAHAFNNIISAHAVWNYLQGKEFATVALYLYLPLLIVTAFLFTWQFPRIKNSVSIGYKDLKTYILNDTSIGESNRDKFIRIILDLLFGILIFGLSLII